MKIEELITSKRTTCMGCEACANICPNSCIEMKTDSEGFRYPIIDKSKCSGCGQCDSVCPALNVKERPLIKLPTALAAVNINWNVRRKSSSGGAFGALAEGFIKRGGIVFGAAFDDGWQIFHTAVESLDELYKLRGAKYVQSKIGDIYRQVKAALENGREVLFSGTPCQIAGLKYFLGLKDYNNLTLIDVECKGVTPPTLWKNYIDRRRCGHSIEHISFFDKQNGADNPLFRIVFKDRGRYLTAQNTDVFMQGYLSGLTLRPSCGDCRFRGLNRLSDLTLADFNGARELVPELFDNRGTSLVLIHSDKGSNLINATQLTTKAVELKNVIERNPHLLVSLLVDQRRTEFFNDLSKSSEPLAVLNKFYIQNFVQHLQSLNETLIEACKKEWIAVEQKLFRPLAVQPVEMQTLQSVVTQQPVVEPPTKKTKENILIITVPQNWMGGAHAFVEHYIKEECQGKGVFLLRQIIDKSVAKLTLSDLQKNNMTYTFEKTEPALTNLTKYLGITSIFVNHLITFDLLFIMNWIEHSKIPYTYFIHDYFCVCPNVNLECHAGFCASNMKNPICRLAFLTMQLPQVSIENWRAIFSTFLSRAKHVYAPSKYTAGIVRNFYRSVDIESKPHRITLPIVRTFNPTFAERAKLRIVFLGNMQRIKGEEYLLLANEFIQSKGLPIEFVVMGSYYEEFKIGSKQGIIFTSRYDNKNVSGLLAFFETAIVAQLSTVFETYCYAASEAILSGYPVLALNIGAHASRIMQHDCGWILPIGTPSRGIEEFKLFLQFIITPDGRKQIGLKAANTIRFQNGME